MTDTNKVIEGMEQFREDFVHCCGNHADWERFDAGLALLKEMVDQIHLMEEILREYHKADVFLAVHGWWGDNPPWGVPTAVDLD